MLLEEKGAFHLENLVLWATAPGGDFWHEMKTHLNPYFFSLLGSLYLSSRSDTTLDAVASLAGSRIMLQVRLIGQSKINSVKIFPGSP